MDLDAQVRERRLDEAVRKHLRTHFSTTHGACHSHKQFERLVTSVVDLVRDAEAGKLMYVGEPPPEPTLAPEEPAAAPPS